MKDKINIGIIQTVMDAKAAWEFGAPMSPSEAAAAIHQVELGFRSFKDSGHSPDIVLLPELAIPGHYVEQLMTLGNDLKAIVISGVDYRFDVASGGYINEAVVIIPSVLGTRRLSRLPYIRKVRKCYPAPAEAAGLAKFGQQFTGGSEVPIFDAGSLGFFSVAICYDLTDVQRLALYRPHIQHLFVLAYNQDLNSFRYVAEAAARMDFANIVICNTGFFGGSLCISPYYEPHMRTVFSFEGQKLFSAQIFAIEVEDLANHQRSPTMAKKWKSLPPGFDGQQALSLATRAITTTP